MTDAHRLDQLETSLRDRLNGLVAARWPGGFRAEHAVVIAADLVAAGVDDPAVVELAMQPTDPNSLRLDDICSLFDACCAAIGVTTPTKGAAGWQRARDIASAIISGVVTPAEGAAELWPLLG